MAPLVISAPAGVKLFVNDIDLARELVKDFLQQRPHPISSGASTAASLKSVSMVYPASHQVGNQVICPDPHTPLENGRKQSGIHEISPHQSGKSKRAKKVEVTSHASCGCTSRSDPSSKNAISPEPQQCGDDIVAVTDSTKSALKFSVPTRNRFEALSSTQNVDGLNTVSESSDGLKNCLCCGLRCIPSDVPNAHCLDCEDMIDESLHSEALHSEACG